MQTKKRGTKIMNIQQRKKELEKAIADVKKTSSYSDNIELNESSIEIWELQTELKAITETEKAVNQAWVEKIDDIITREEDIFEKQFQYLTLDNVSIIKNNIEKWKELKKQMEVKE